MAYTTINKSTDYFNTKIYTGTGSSNAITGIGFAPDWLWLKSRNTATSNQLVDNVRGATKMLASNVTDAEFTDANRVASLDSDGMTLGTNSNTNGSGTPYISWLWKANGQGSANTDGSINTTYTSANTTSGFSIIKYNGNGSAGATIGHGLGVAPKCVIIKRTDTTSNWIFGTGATGFTKFLYLNTTDTEQTNSGTFNDTAPSSSLITLGSWNDVNNSSGTYIAYAFAEKKGFSKFGSYTGNGNADGTFIYTGFKPAFIIIKKDATDFWFMYDNKRGDINANAKTLKANTSDAEGTSGKEIDFLSNGVKIRNSNNSINTNGSTYIYMVFAEEPLVASNGIPATAR